MLSDRSAPDIPEVLMKLRRALAAAATVAALAAPGPILSLSVSAPTASADVPADRSPDPGDTPHHTSRAEPGSSASESATASASGPASQTPDPAGSPSPEASTSTEPTTPSPDAPLPSVDPGQPTLIPPPPPVGESPDTERPDDGDSGSGEATGEAVPAEAWTPGQCTDFVTDDSLLVDVSGLPNRIVAGSGWHPFTFSVTNRSHSSVRRLYVQNFTEYGRGVNEQDSLQRDLARLQYHDPVSGRWTDAFQDHYLDRDGRHPYTGTFVALVSDLPAGQRVDLRLRVRISARAPAGAAFSLSTAVYAGHGSTCHLNGDSYDFTVLRAGSDPGRVGYARPNGEKPTSAPDYGTRPQGAQVVPVQGELAETGTSEAVPIIGVVGACTVFAGALLVFASRRRAMALATYEESADNAEDAEGAGNAEDAETLEESEEAAESAPPKGVAPHDTDGPRDRGVSPRPARSSDGSDPADPAPAPAAAPPATGTDDTGSGADPGAPATPRTAPDAPDAVDRDPDGPGAVPGEGPDSSADRGTPHDPGQPPGPAAPGGS